ncbi:MAG: 3-oxoacid CoA-transferase [Lentisphaerae bacterium RIFOXYB12_FULL_65_16]|nr:MAG: 3-oxoacid CoA-transferase [Lentisphaerae bacterium RIFOXYA12_64_32]OGV88933.1 MAG: 3-oxoacid CoA-transferase [Lentisphaerae bacterium RIFOXYB12_FULL_65_16]
MPDYNAMELMICIAARLLEDGSTLGVGTGAPCAAAMLAQKTHAPSLFVAFEAGGLAPLLPSMPISVGDSRTFYKGLMATSMCDIMEACQRGMVDYTFLGGAQIDMYGNLNSTVIGPHGKPAVRFPGSGGANDFASLCWRTMVLTQHDKRRFVAKLDFLTSPGFLTGPGAREAAGLPKDTGPYKVITDLAVMGFHAESKRMQVESLHPGVTFEQVQANTGFELLKAARVTDSEPPRPNELRILRDEVDPYRYVIGR